MRKTLNLVVVVTSAVVCASSAGAQTPGQNTSGSYSNTYPAPAWGQTSPGAWGTHSGNVGQGGWQYNRTPQANQPAGNSAYPNATSRPFGRSNPLTTRGRRF
jgi:hypothetical protein